jgi:hypothetical protein
VTASVAGEKCYFAAFKRAANVGVGRRAERGLYADLFRSGQSGHGVQATPADDADFRLGQISSSIYERKSKLLIIPNADANAFARQIRATLFTTKGTKEDEGNLLHKAFLSLW